MKFRKGDIHWNYVIGGVLGGIVLFLVFTGAWRTVQPIVFAVELIGFNVSTVAQGNGIVGLNLDGGELQYYDGEKFKKFTNQGVAVLGGYEFNIKDVQGNLSNFYFKTPRRPEKLSVEVNHWRYWDVFNQMDTRGIVIQPHTKKGYAGSDYDGSFLILDNSDNSVKEFPFQFVLSSTYSKVLAPGLAYIEYSFNSQSFSKVLEWRDSILQGNSCEKFLTLRVKHNGVDKDLIYTVRRSEGYLAVDLTKPISFGVDKWSNEKCFKFDNYEDKEKNLKNEVKNVTFSYTSKSGLFAKRYAHKLYWFPEFPWWSGNFQDLTHRSDIGDIYPGIVEAFRKDGLFDKAHVIIAAEGFVDQGVFINDLKISNLDFVNGKEFGSLSDEERNKFIYFFMNEYNKNFIPRGLE